MCYDARMSEASNAVEAGSMYLDEGSGRTWEIVGHIADLEYLCIGEPSDGKAPEVLRMMAACINERMTLLGPAVEPFDRWRPADDGRRCICCGRSERLTAEQHADRCVLAKLERARALSTPEAKRVRSERLARFRSADPLPFNDGRKVAR